MFSVQELFKSYGTQVILKDINLQFERGQFVALMGKNGSGKSTLLRVLAQQEVYQGGEITFSGQSLKNPTIKINDKLAFITEEQGLPLQESIEKWSEYFKVSAPHFRSEIFFELSRKLEVDIKKQFWVLSRGQKMKALFCLQAAKVPDVYLLDEITSVLDSGSRLALMEFLSLEKARGCLIVVSTNIGSELEGFATDICFLEGSRVVLNCPKNKISQYFSKVRSQGPLTSEAFKKIEASGAKKVNLNSDGTWSFLVKHEKSKSVPSELNPDMRAITFEDVSSYYAGGKV